MKKLFTKIAGLTLGLAMAVGVGVTVSSKKISEAKAEEKTLTFDLKSNPGGWPSSNSTTLTNYTYTLDKVDYTFALKNVKCNSGYLMLTQPAALGLPALNGFKLTKVLASNSSGCSTTVNVGISSSASTAAYISGGEVQTWSKQSSSYTYELDETASNTMYYLYVTNKNAQIVTLTLTYASAGVSKTLNSIDSIEGSLEAYVGDKAWDLTTLTPKGTLSDDTTKEVDISDYVELKTDDVPGTELGSKKVTVHVIDLLKTVASKAFDVDGEVLAIPPVPVTHTMADCYTVAKGTNVKFNGVYMGAYGTNPYQGIFFADGEYGIMVYGTSSVSSDWEVGKTVLAISGQTDYYNGLVQIKSASFQVTSATVAVPVVYEFTGAETTPAALSRKTSLSGKVTALKNAFESDKDTTVTIDLGGEKSASVFVKKGVFTNAQLAEFKAGFVVDNEVTVTGFLNYYKSGQTIDTAYTPSAFQIIVPTIVKVGTYTAHDYALDFISATDAVCSTPFGEDGHLTGLLAIWTELNTKYSALKDAEKVAFANPDTTDTDIKAAIARYDYICGKYNAGGVVLTEFVEGHIVPTLSLAFTRDYKVQTNTPMIIVICCAVASVTALGILIVIKRRKSSVK